MMTDAEIDTLIEDMLSEQARVLAKYAEDRAAGRYDTRIKRSGTTLVQDISLPVIIEPAHAQSSQDAARYPITEPPAKIARKSRSKKTAKALSVPRCACCGAQSLYNKTIKNCPDTLHCRECSAVHTTAGDLLIKFPQWAQGRRRYFRQCAYIIYTALRDWLAGAQ